MYLSSIAESLCKHKEIPYPRSTFAHNTQPSQQQCELV